MKMKVLDVVTMAGNDHRVSLENDEVKIDIQFKSYEAFAEVDFKPGDEIDDLFGLRSGSGSDVGLLISAKDEQIAQLKDEKQSLSDQLAKLDEVHATATNNLMQAKEEKASFIRSLESENALLSEAKKKLEDEMAELKKAHPKIFKKE